MKKYILILCAMLCVLTMFSLTSAAAEVKEFGRVSVDVPYYGDGLTVVDLEHGGYSKMKITIRNDSGRSLSDMSYIVLKFMNESGVTVDTQNVYIDDLNAGETCTKFLWFDYSTRSVKFGATKLVDADESSILGSVSTVAVGNMNLNSPYTRDGLTFTAVKTWSDRVQMTVFNGNDVPVMSGRVEYKTFDKNSQVLNSSSAWLPMLDAGETALIDFYCGKNTKTLIFGNVTLYDGKESGQIATTKVRNLTSNTLPADVGGITITKLSFSGRRIEVNYTNNTGMAISSNSRIYYKTYDANGYVLESNSFRLPDMNPGENGFEQLYVEKATSTILFFSPEIEEGVYVEKPATTVVRGVEINVVPYTSNGLTIESIVIKSRRVLVTVRNNTGAAISSGSFEFRCLDKNGVALDTRSIYIGSLNNGEAELVTGYMTSGSKAAIFSDGKYWEGNELNLNVAYNTIRKNLVGNLPYSVNGISIAFSRTFNNYFEVTVTNNTGAEIKNGTIPYRGYDENGIVIENQSLWLDTMSAGESCLLRVNCENTTRKLVFGEPKLY